MPNPNAQPPKNKSRRKRFSYKKKKSNVPEQTIAQEESTDSSDDNVCGSEPEPSLAGPLYVDNSEEPTDSLPDVPASVPDPPVTEPICVDTANKLIPCDMATEDVSETGCTGSASNLSFDKCSPSLDSQEVELPMEAVILEDPVNLDTADPVYPVTADESENIVVVIIKESSSLVEEDVEPGVAQAADISQQDDQLTICDGGRRSPTTDPVSPSLDFEMAGPSFEGIVGSDLPINNEVSGVAGAPGGSLSGVLDYVEGQLKQRLPSNWFPLKSTQGIQVGLRLSSEILVVQRSAFFAEDGRIVIGIHGKSLPSDHGLWANMTNIPLSSDNPEDFVTNILSTVKILRLHEVCRGVENYRHLWKTVENVTIDMNPYFENAYSNTCRATTCMLLMSSLKTKRCSECHKVAKKMSQLNRTRPANVFNTPPKTKPIKYCNTPEKLKRLQHASEEMKKIKRANQQLKKKLGDVMRKEGMRLKNSMSESIIQILNSPEAQGKLTDVQKMFIEELVKSTDAKDPRGVRWHPGMIALAISIQSSSPGAYEELSGLLKLPSGRQLYNYTHCIEDKDGVNTEIIRDLAEDPSMAHLKDFQRDHNLSFDEMYIRKNLVFEKQTGELIGYVKTDNLDEELARLEKVLSDKSVGLTTGAKPPPPIATKILCYMVQGVANSVRSVVACYSVANLTKEVLYFNTWEVIGELELRGLRVISVACDGASTNQAFFQMHFPLERTASGVVFVTLNLFSGRPLFFINDPAHLLKTCRNNLYYSGKKNLRGKGKNKSSYIRLLTKNGQTLTWNTVRRVYDKQKDNTLRTTWKLNKEDVELNSFSMMKVPLAAHVMSRSLATEVRLYEWEESLELANFCQAVNDFFDMTNGLHSFQATRRRNDLLESYKSIDDERFGKLMDILNYFEEWNDQVKQLNEKPKEKRFISDQTFTGIERTIRGFIGSVKLVLTEGQGEDPPPYVNGRVFSSDNLEKYFSKVRSMFGANTHPNLKQARQASVKLHSRSGLPFQGRKRSNVGSGEVSLRDLQAPKTKKSRKSI